MMTTGKIPPALLMQLIGTPGVTQLLQPGVNQPGAPGSVQPPTNTVGGGLPGMNIAGLVGNVQGQVGQFQQLFSPTGPATPPRPADFDWQAYAAARPDIANSGWLNKPEYQPIATASGVNENNMARAYWDHWNESTRKGENGGNLSAYPRRAQTGPGAQQPTGGQQQQGTSTGAGAPAPAQASAGGGFGIVGLIVAGIVAYSLFADDKKPVRRRRVNKATASRRRRKAAAKAKAKAADPMAKARAAKRRKARKSK